MSRLEGKTAVITGGSGGIGRAAGRLFAAEGANVLLVDIDESALADAQQYCKSNQVSTCIADVTIPADNERMVQTAVSRYGGVDILLANAGIEGQVTSILNYDEEVFDRVMAVNVKGPWLGLRATIPEMQKRGGGAVVITSSVAGLRGSPFITPYSTSKHAVIGLMRSAAKECAPMNIRVNTVNPSPVETSMMRRLESGHSAGDPERAHRQIAASVPMGRYAEPEEIARVMLFLVSDDAGWVTGGVYAADGGNTA